MGDAEVSGQQSPDVKYQGVQEPEPQDKPDAPSPSSGDEGGLQADVKYQG